MKGGVGARHLAAVGVALLLAMMAFGVAARPQVSVSLDPIDWSPGGGGAMLVAGLLATCAWVLAATLVFARSSASGDLRRAFRRAALLNLALLVLTMGLSAREFSMVHDAPRPDLTPITDRRDPWTTELDIPGVRWVVLGLLVLSVLAGIVLIGWTVWTTRGRFFRDRTGVLRERRAGLGARASASVEDVRQAVSRARRALLSDEDARRAVIAAYAAMERSVSAHGVPRGLSQTPGEFLHQAVADGVLTDRAATAELLRLFELARFSHLPMPADAVDVMASDLDRLATDLDRLATDLDRERAIR